MQGCAFIPLLYLGDSEDVMTYVFWILLALGGLYLLRIILRYSVSFLSHVFYVFFRVFCFPFNFLNGLQRHLSKPWRIFYKNHHGSDGFNKFMRGFWNILKIPLYFLLAPLRLVNAIFYNIVVHVSFEFFNYLAEILDPTSRIEGGANFITWLLMVPWRLVKYPWHFLLTLVESCVWTAVDTIVPALTLYHGTDQAASESITQSPGRLQTSDSYMGIWNVGGGNFAGNGIYFAPIRSTSEHYARNNSRQALIVCRVSLGKVLDLGMAPKHVFRECGSADALGVTRWGLDHGFTTGEWWRPDEGWWEYCMYDWQNRYNNSWRIRPLYVEDLSESRVQRIHGGMVHWLFRSMVIKDIFK